MKIYKGINVAVSSLVELEVSRHVLILQQPGPQRGLVPVPSLQAAASTECFDSGKLFIFVLQIMCVRNDSMQYFNYALMHISISYGWNLKFIFSLGLVQPL